jgi:hypothetical protein
MRATSSRESLCEWRIEGQGQISLSVEPNVVETEGEGVPTEFGITGVYPNPFNDQTLVRFSIPDQGGTTLTLYDLMGKRVSELLDRRLAAGEHSLIVDGASLPSGRYYLKLRLKSREATQEITKIK